MQIRPVLRECGCCGFLLGEEGLGLDTDREGKLLRQRGKRGSVVKRAGERDRQIPVLHASFYLCLDTYTD